MSGPRGRTRRAATSSAACSGATASHKGSGSSGPFRPAVLGADAFTVDPNQSSISISGSVLGSSVKEQGSGSLTTQFTGSLLADVTANSIQFTGQSDVVARDSGNWEPLEDGSDGRAPANYGGTASAFLTTVAAALRRTELDLTSGVIALANGQFDIGRANGDEPFSSVSIPTSVAAHPRRSPHL